MQPYAPNCRSSLSQRKSIRGSARWKSAASGRYAAEYDGDGDLDYDDLVGGAYASFSAWGGP